MSHYIHSSHGWNKERTIHPFIQTIIRKMKKTGFVKNLLLLGLFCFVLGSLFLLGFMAVMSRDLPNPGSLTERTVSQTTKIYDRTGDHVLYEIFGNENRTLKKLQKGFCDSNSSLEKDEKGIPLFVVQATISAEDHGFCEHHGFDYKGFARAVLLNLIGKRVGGSTLTQQLVKNAILSNEKTITRKLKELILSIELERKYSKDEILQIYLNEIPYGSTYYGIEAASQNFYSKSVNDLSIAQAATLAALPKSTTTYLNNPDLLKIRRDYILSEMQKLGFIDTNSMEQAKKEDTSIKVHISNITAPHFVMYVKDQLEEKYGRRTVEEGGLKVITTLDYDKQIIAEEEIKKGVESRGQQYGFSNAALIAENPRTGEIISMVGSKDYFDDSIDGQVNVTTRLRQPGSSFKPIVYTKAFEMGYTPNTILWDVVTSFPTVTGTYTPHNYDLKEHGPLRLRDALQMSLNIPAVKTVLLVGVEPALDFATSLGYTSFENHANFGPSIVLGGGEVKLIEHTGAYATFANNGMLREQVTILKVENPDGSVLEEWKQKDGKQIISENIASMISNVLSDNDARTPIFGAKSTLQLGDRPVAAKSGTTNDFHDAWLMGYTPSLAVGVWVGNNDNKEMKNHADGSVVAGPIWNAFMKRSLATSPVESFPNPDIPKTGKSVLDGDVPGERVMIDRASGKRATEYTPESFKEERIYAEYHEILRYVNPSDPLGDPPKISENDKNYQAWETGLKTWISLQEKTTGKVLSQTIPPNEFDDVHVPANFPSVSISFPTNNTIVSGGFVNVVANASAPRGISRLEYFLDGQYLGSRNQQPFNNDVQIPSSFSNGTHSLKVIAFDDIDNSGSTSVEIQLEQNIKTNLLQIIDPKNEQTMEKNGESYTVVVSVPNPTDYSQITVFAESVGSGNKMIIAQVNNPTTSFVTFEWNLPSIGKWAIFATGKQKNASVDITTSGVVVQIKPSGSSSSLTTSTNLNPFH